MIPISLHLGAVHFVAGCGGVAEAGVVFLPKIVH